ncbi:hypothetical protein KY284_012724 [Solanum tuberosum]|nr:hypothetical protein KY284_012724 [Solanum tuberosum]
MGVVIDGRRMGEEMMLKTAGYYCFSTVMDVSLAADDGKGAWGRKTPGEGGEVMRSVILFSGKGEEDDVGLGNERV